MTSHYKRPKDWQTMDEWMISYPFQIYADNTLYPYDVKCGEWVTKTLQLGDDIVGDAKIPEFYWGFYEWCLENDPSHDITAILRKTYKSKKDDEDLGSFLIRVIGAAMYARPRYNRNLPEWLIAEDRKLEYEWRYDPDLFDGDADEWESRAITTFSVHKNDYENMVPITDHIYLSKFHWAYHDWLLKHDTRDVTRYILDECIRRYDLTPSQNYEWAIMCIFEDRAQKKLPQPEWIIVEKL
jgi:hypothetical protein